MKGDSTMCGPKSFVGDGRQLSCSNDDCVEVPFKDGDGKLKEIEFKYEQIIYKFS